MSRNTYFWFYEDPDMMIEVEPLMGSQWQTAHKITKEWLTDGRSPTHGRPIHSILKQIVDDDWEYPSNYDPVLDENGKVRWVHE